MQCAVGFREVNMKRYKIETWGISVWIGETQIGAAVGCLPFALSDGTHWHPESAKVGRIFTAEEFVMF